MSIKVHWKNLSQKNTPVALGLNEQKKWVWEQGRHGFKMVEDGFKSKIKVRIDGAENDIGNPEDCFLQHFPGGGGVYSFFTGGLKIDLSEVRGGLLFSMCPNVKSGGGRLVSDSRYNLRDKGVPGTHGVTAETMDTLRPKTHEQPLYLCVNQF